MPCSTFWWDEFRVDGIIYKYLRNFLTEAGWKQHPLPQENLKKYDALDRQVLISLKYRFIGDSLVGLDFRVKQSNRTWPKVAQYPDRDLRSLHLAKQDQKECTLRLFVGFRVYEHAILWSSGNVYYTLACFNRYCVGHDT